MTITQKQRQLYFLGYYDGKIDGIWGDKSRNGTKQFQADNGLWADGIFGFATEDKSTEIIKGIQKVVGTTVDGLAGEKTKAATAEFQKKNGLTATGIADEKTRAKISGGNYNTVSDTASNTTSSTTNKTASGTWWDEIKYFDRSEFACKCGKYCNGFPVEPKEVLVRLADRAREEFGSPATISSGVRCSQHNANVGGVSNSKHKYGVAMDISIKGVSGSKLYAWAQKQPEVRYTYIIEGNWVHIDVNA